MDLTHPHLHVRDRALVPRRSIMLVRFAHCEREEEITFMQGDRNFLRIDGRCVTQPMPPWFTGIRLDSAQPTRCSRRCRRHKSPSSSRSTMTKRLRRSAAPTPMPTKMEVYWVAGVALSTRRRRSRCRAVVFDRRYQRQPPLPTVLPTSGAIASRPMSAYAVRQSGLAALAMASASFDLRSGGGGTAGTTPR